MRMWWSYDDYDWEYIYKTLMVDEVKKNIYMMNIYIFKFDSPLPPLVIKRFLVLCLLVMPKDIRVKEGFAAKWAHQPHA